jgi:acyl-CoA synthetase (AMP-forming)/AMP-acid ligase II
MSHPLPTLIDFIDAQARSHAEHPAILAPGRTDLSFAALAECVRYTAEQLRDAGIHANDRVALVVPNGPEMATAFLATACAASSAPLNPAYLESDYEYYLHDLDAKLVVVASSIDSPVRPVAARMGIPVAELKAETASPAGTFTIEAIEPSADSNVAGAIATGTDTALVLHTSGTTSRPKMVPLSHANICASASHIKHTLQLSNADRCLNVMPLFHIHGLVAALVSSLAAGAGVICTSGYRDDAFFEWIGDLRPTWYTAVPTMHQSILSAAPAHSALIAAAPLRFIRSSSAALSSHLMRELETTFAAPVIEAYGMTEAAHQMASNPLPPGIRKERSVGPAAGPEIAIMDEAGRLLPAERTGEIVIRGDNVTRAYVGNPEANDAAFTSGWFRTGDQGYLDEDGYLFITGRLKEIINRGGEKVSPREIDEALMAHPEIDVAVGFAIPHPTLGEDVAAAVVLAAGSQLTARAVRDFAFDRLIDFKVPSRVLIVDDIPKGPTGKVQRVGLARQFEQQLRTEYLEPDDDLETLVANTICDVLKLARVGADDNFFAIGGDSLTGNQVISRLNDIFHAQIPIVTLFRKPTVRELAREISDNVKVEDPELIDQLLNELEDLTEAEVAALLDQGLERE